MEPFIEWLRQQMHQQGLNCRILARRSSLTTCKITQAVAQHVAPTAMNVCRLAEYFDVDPEAVRMQGRIIRSEAAELCRLGSKQAKRLLTRMDEHGQLVQTGARKGAYYELAPNI